LMGTVTMGSDTVAAALRAASDAPDVAAIVLRVDSPGGSYVASDTIWRETVLTKKAGKPLIVSMGNLAGSGGYYVSLGGGEIFADRTTLTASIGVVTGKLVTTDMWNKIGISWKTYQEDIDGLSCPVTDSYPYAVRHNPFAFFDDVTGSSSPPCTSVMRPLSELATDLASNTVAHYNFITPNVCSDMHDSCAPTSNPVKQGDNWLAQYVPIILNSTAYQNNGLIIITWDEGENGVDGPIGMIVLSPFAKGSGYHSATRYAHSATLRTLQKIFGRAPLLGGAANAPDLSDLFVNGAIPTADSPTVTTTVASNVAGGSATLGGSVNPNGDQTQTWFEYGPTTAYGTDTRSRSSDDAESYATWAYGNNGGSGFGAITYREGTGGGIFLEAGSGKIDGAKSFGMFAGGGTGNTQAADRQILNAKAAGTLALSVRWNVNNTVSFSGFNLKSATGTHFGDNELISVGIRPGNGNNTIAVNGGAQTINLGSSVLGQVIDLDLQREPGPILLPRQPNRRDQPERTGRAIL